VCSCRESIEGAKESTGENLQRRVEGPAAGSWQAEGEKAQNPARGLRRGRDKMERISVLGKINSEYEDTKEFMGAPQV
jgi:hypothetical protein